MLLVKLLHFIFGYVRFRAEDGFPERFINLCSRSNIVLWNVESRKGVLYANASVRGYRAIRPAARKSGMRVHAIEKHGLTFFLHKHKKRVGLLLGFLLFLGSILFLATRVWTIDVAGTQSVTPEELLTVCSELGFQRGISRRSVEVEALEIAVLDRMPELSWLSINLKGSGAVIEVREKGKKAALEDPNTPADIIAARSGTLLAIEAYRGTRLKKAGDYVLRGEALISGVTMNLDNSAVLRNASGYVTARTSRKISATAEREQLVYTVQALKNSYTLQFLWLQLPFGKRPDSPEPGYAYSFTRWLELNRMRMPLELTRSTALTLTASSVTHSAQQARLLALEAQLGAVTAQLEHTKPEKQKLSCTETENGCSIEGSYTVIENVGLHRPLEAQQKNASKP